MMENLWDEAAAEELGTGLALRAWSAGLIASDRRLGVAAAGSASWKGQAEDLFGLLQPVLWVTPAGRGLIDVTEADFTGLVLAEVMALAPLSGRNLQAGLSRARLDPAAAPAAENALIHALIPAPFVEFAQCTAVLSLATAGGIDLLRQVLGADILLLPAQGSAEELDRLSRASPGTPGLGGFTALIHEQHGIFTWGQSARDSYQRLISLCGAAETWFAAHLSPLVQPERKTDPLAVAKLRAAVSKQAGHALVSLPAVEISAGQLEAIAALSRDGRVRALSQQRALGPLALISEEWEQSFDNFSAGTALAANNGGQAEAPPAPYRRWSVSRQGAFRVYAPEFAAAALLADLAEASVTALYRAAQMPQERPLGPRPNPAPPDHDDTGQGRLCGKVAVVSGAAAGIGRASAEALRDAGAVVIGLDVDPSLRAHMSQPGYEGYLVDMTSEKAVSEALARVVDQFGGLDMLVSNVGIFRTGAMIEQLSDAVWDDTLAVNLTSHRKLLKQAVPYLRHGIDPAVVFIGSRNALAPGPGAAAYSVSKAGLTQLMRVAALELAPEGITVNAIHPDAVFDTKLWTQEALESSARRYGLSVEAYKTRNLMRTEVRSVDVARVVVALVDGTFSRTTGAQIPVDGGNIRVI